MTTPLEDAFGRRIEYLRLDEIERVACWFGRMGTHRVRLSGGEPLVRRRLGRRFGPFGQLPLEARQYYTPGGDLPFSSKTVF